MSRAYHPYIDGLRALAVLSVIAYHLNPAWLHGGFLGVDVFFVISGYVVSASLAARPERALSAFSSGFYARRILRIAPALLACLLVTQVVSALFIPQAWLSTSIDETARYAFFGLSNYKLITSGDSYFAPRSEFNPYTHTWSLGVEEQFYLIFPALFYLWICVDEKSKVRRFLAPALLVALFALSIAFAGIETSHDKTLAFYSLFTRFWELAAGVLLYKVSGFLNRTRLATRPWLTLGVQYLAFFLILAGFAFVDTTAVPIPGALLPTLGTLGLLWSMQRPETASSTLRAMFSTPLAVFIGKISYALYLWHWPVIVLFRWTVGFGRPASYLAAVLLMTVLSLLSYYLIERPVRFSPLLSKVSSLQVVLGGLSVLLLSWALGNVITRHQPDLSLSTVSQHADLWYADRELPRQGPDLGQCQVVKSGRALSTTTVVQYEKQDCQVARTTANLFVIGDSHVGAYAQMFKRVAEERDFNVSIYGLGGCPFLDFRQPMRQGSATCKQFAQESVADILTRSKAGDVVFLSSLRLSRLGDQWHTRPTAPTGQTVYSNAALADIRAALEEAPSTVAPLLAAGLTVVLEAPKPIFSAPPFRCADWFNATNPVCAAGLSKSRDELLTYRRPIVDAMETLAAQSPRIRIWDPFSILCPDAVCTTVARGSGMPLFFDGDHLSGYANTLLFAPFADFADTLIEHRASPGSETLALVDVRGTTAPPQGGQCFLDRVDNRDVSQTGRVLRLRAGERLRLEAWAVDPEVSTLPSAARIRLDSPAGTYEVAAKRIERSDLVAALHNPSYLRAGVLLDGSLATLPPGVYTAKVVQKRGEGTIACDLAYTIDVMAADAEQPTAQAAGTLPLVDVGRATAPKEGGRCFLDRVGDQAVAQVGELLRLRHGERMRLDGWAFDPETGTTPPEATFRLDSDAGAYEVSARRVDRSDLAEAFHNSAYAKAGLAVDGPLADIPRGTYDVKVVQKRGDERVACDLGFQVEVI